MVEEPEAELGESHVHLSCAHTLINGYLPAEHLQRTWVAPIYAFFAPDVIVGHEDGCRYHEFKCAARPCKGQKGLLVKHYLDTADTKSTSNLRRHTKKCWGIEAVERADDADDADEV